jgi:hypothetical protein
VKDVLKRPSEFLTREQIESHIGCDGPADGEEVVYQVGEYTDQGHSEILVTYKLPNRAYDFIESEHKLGLYSVQDIIGGTVFISTVVVKG